MPSATRRIIRITGTAGEGETKKVRKNQPPATGTSSREYFFFVWVIFRKPLTAMLTSAAVITSPFMPIAARYPVAAGLNPSGGSKRGIIFPLGGAFSAGFLFL